MTDQTQHAPQSYPLHRDIAMTRAHDIQGLSQREVGQRRDLTGDAKGLTRQRVNDIIRRTRRTIVELAAYGGDDYACVFCSLTHDELAAIRVAYGKQLRRWETDPRRKHRGEVTTTA
jgi:hypothetical protein